MDINKKYIVDEKGNPKEVIIPTEHFRKMEELLGWDLEDETTQQLPEAKMDREKCNKEAYIELDAI
jgi:hypothetical protein